MSWQRPPAAAQWATASSFGGAGSNLAHGVFTWVDGREAEAALSVVRLECPAQTGLLDILEVARLEAFERLVCFGDRRSPPGWIWPNLRVAQLPEVAGRRRRRGP
jgi:hypothetical protein